MTLRVVCILILSALIEGCASLPAEVPAAAAPAPIVAPAPTETAPIAVTEDMKTAEEFLASFDATPTPDLSYGQKGLLCGIRAGECPRGAECYGATLQGPGQCMCLEPKGCFR